MSAPEVGARGAEQEAGRAQPDVEFDGNFDARFFRHASARHQRLARIDVENKVINYMIEQFFKKIPKKNLI